MMKKLIPYILLFTLILSNGCRSMRGGGDWYSGPAEHRGAMEHSINNALAELPREVGRPLKWDWKQRRVTLRVIEPSHYTSGIPQVTLPDGRKAGGYAFPTGLIVVPRGFRMGTLRHEGGHLVLFANGMPDGNVHHGYQYFRRHTYERH